jgi:hypothetical protein
VNRVRVYVLTGLRLAAVACELDVLGYSQREEDTTNLTGPNDGAGYKPFRDRKAEAWIAWIEGIRDE